MKRQGEKVLQPTNKPKDMKKQVVARSPRRTGQPTTRQNIQPKVAAQTVKRVVERWEVILPIDVQKYEKWIK